MARPSSPPAPSVPQAPTAPPSPSAPEASILSVPTILSVPSLLPPLPARYEKKRKHFERISFVSVIIKALFKTVKWYHFIIWTYMLFFFSAVMYNGANKCAIPISSWKFFGFYNSTTTQFNCNNFFQAFHFTIGDGLGLFLKIFFSSASKNLADYSLALAIIKSVVIPVYSGIFLNHFRINLFDLIKKAV